MRANTTRTKCLLVMWVTAVLVTISESARPSVQVVSPTREALFGMAVARQGESTKLYAVGSKGVVLVSADTGRTWEQREIISAALPPDYSLLSDYDLLNIGFSADGHSGWIVGEDGLILHTADGGRSWAAQQSGVHSRLFAVAALSPETACIVGSDGVLLRTNDGGKSWVLQKSRNIVFFGVSFPDAHNGWAVGEFQTILQTVDGGVTWQLRHGGVRSGAIPPYFAVAFSDPRRGWISGMAGAMLSTEDGGHNWHETKLPVPESRSLFSIALTSDADAWAAGAGGLLFRLTAGQWKSQASTTRSDLTSIVLLNGMLVGVGMDGTIIRFEDQ
jgi:photosystem II stability/assembly factor-like uncharacterized protein